MEKLKAILAVPLFALCTPAYAVYAEKELAWKERFRERLVPLPTFQKNTTQHHVSLVDEHCKTVTINFWSGSSHPGGNKRGRLQESNRGLGFKCRTTDDHPVFYSFDTMTNSQDRPTLAMSVGKQIDLVNVDGLKLYVGGTITGIAYGKRKPHHDVFGPAPLGLGGFSYNIPGRYLPAGMKATVGAEQLMIPNPDKDERGFIRLRSFNMQVTWKRNIF